MNLFNRVVRLLTVAEWDVSPWQKFMLRCQCRYAIHRARSIEMPTINIKRAGRGEW